jgi:hypothetical protein
VVAVGINAGGALSGVTTLAASGLASLDGGININDDFTVNTDGAVVAVGINAGGAVSGVTTLAASGLLSVASISMDDGSTLGPDSVADLWTFNADGDTTQKDGAYDFDIASHDGTNGLKLGGALVNASAADLNFTNVASAGTAEASKCLVVDASKDVSGINALGIASMASNWTNASRTVADMGSVTTIDINGGTIDATVIGGVTPAAIEGTTISGSGAFSIGGALNMRNIASANPASASMGFAFMDGSSTALRTYSMRQFFTDLCASGSDGAGSAILFQNDALRVDFAEQAALDGDNIASGDLFGVADVSDGNYIKKITLANVADALAGNGIKDDSAALALDFDSLGAAVVNVANDSIAFLDADNSTTKKESVADLVSAMAGAGLTATNGVLSSDASPTPTDHNNANGTLAEGMNWSSAVFTAARTWTLPASAGSDAGDVVSVKAPSNAQTYRLTIARAGSQTIDGETELVLDSPHAAIDLVYVGSDKWVIK